MRDGPTLTGVVVLHAIVRWAFWNPVRSAGIDPNVGK
jgi:hypothetical protein